MRTNITRRQFGVRAAGIAAALAGASRLSAADTAQPIPIGIQAYSLRNYSTDDAIRLAKEMGFAHIEFYKGMLATDASNEAIDALRAKMDAAGLKMLGHGVNRFTKNHDANRQMFEFAARAGLRNLTADPDPESFDSLDRLVDEYDIRIAIHNHGPRHRYNKALDVVNACRDHDQRIGACADLGHYIRSGERPTDVIRLLEGRLYGIHLKDFAAMEDMAEGVILGRGHLDMVGVFQALAQTRFPSDGCLSIEYEENPQDPIAEIRECLKEAKAAAAKASV